MSTELIPTQTQIIAAAGAHLNGEMAAFDYCWRLADAVADSSLLPDHLRLDPRGNPLPFEVRRANCFVIARQAYDWKIPFFSVVPESYFVKGKLSFQGKLVAAVVNSRAGLKTRLDYSFAGTGDNLTVTVSGTFEGESEPRTCTLRLGDAKTDNKMWRQDPEQKLIYSGVTKWARRHCPEIILGVLTTDDAEKIVESNEPTPEERAMELHRMDVETIEKYNANLRAQGYPQEMMEPIPPPPTVKADDEIPMVHGWRDVKIVGVSKLAGKTLGNLEAQDLMKLQGVLREMSPAVRASKQGLKELLASVNLAVAELCPKQEPPAKATPAEGVSDGN